MECRNNIGMLNNIKVEIKEEDYSENGTAMGLINQRQLTLELVPALRIKKETVFEVTDSDEDPLSSQSSRLTSEGASQDGSGSRTPPIHSDSGQECQTGEVDHVEPTINETNSDITSYDEMKEFAAEFKRRRILLGLTQAQVGQALSIMEGKYTQTTVSRFENLDITPNNAQKIKPMLEMWIKEAEERYKSGQNPLTEFTGVKASKKRKHRTSFTARDLEVLNACFKQNTHPSGTQMAYLAHELGYKKDVIHIWFQNKRHALKIPGKKMSKGTA